MIKAEAEQYVDEQAKTGGAAFACATESNHQAGMTLRDYFAAKALQGQIVYEGMDGCDPDHIAGCAYELADAMLEARKK